MFNFNELKLDRREDSENTNSFVGIRKNSNNEMVFRLPKGFDDFPENNFEETKKLFFRMYRTFKKFENDSKSLQIDNKPTGKDNIETGGNGYQFKDKENNEVVIYSKISVIENLLEAYNELSLDVIERRTGRNEEINYSKIDRYLHHAIYLEDDITYIGEMDLPRHFLHYESANLIDLFCFILYELGIELEQEIDSRVEELSYRFKEQNLAYDQSLFNEETFDTTIVALKDSLDDIDKVTAYKDEDYWVLYEAIESFLYGELDMENTHEDGVFWGISNFYQIWEDMCNSYSFDKFNVIYADTNIIFDGTQVANHSVGGYQLFKIEEFENPFFIKFRDKKRWIRPDLVHRVEEGTRILEKSIEINITNKHNNRIDFNVYLNDKSEKKIYLLFCRKLKTALNSRKIHGARVIDGNTFKNFPESELQNQKTKLIKSIGNARTSYFILDWKYIDNYKVYNRKLNTDISKQLCYESSLHQYKNVTDIESQFIVPYFYNTFLKHKNGIGYFVDEHLLFKRIVDNKIKVFKADFKKIQEVYLTHG